MPFLFPGVINTPISIPSQAGTVIEDQMMPGENTFSMLSPAMTGQRAIVGLQLLSSPYLRYAPGNVPILDPTTGFLEAPRNAPLPVLEMIAAANEIRDFPYPVPVQHYDNQDLTYLWPAYDCSGATSFLLRAANLIGAATDSTGLESYGRDDIEAADAEILGLALEAAEAAGSGPLAVRIGDARVFDGVLGALGLPDVWLRRVRRGLSQGRPLETVVNGGQGSNWQSGVLAALERADHAGAKALVEDLLAIAGIVPVGGRTAGEIANRFLEQAAARSDPGVSVAEIRDETLGDQPLDVTSALPTSG